MLISPPVVVTLPPLMLPPVSPRFTEPAVAVRLPKLRLPEPALRLMLPALMFVLLVDTDPEALRYSEVSWSVLPAPPDRVPRLMLPPEPLVVTVMELSRALRLPVLTAPAPLLSVIALDSVPLVALPWVVIAPVVRVPATWLKRLASILT